MHKMAVSAAIAAALGGLMIAMPAQATGPERHEASPSKPVQLNGVKVNGLELNGLELNGLELNGLELNGLELNGLELNGLELNGLELNGTRSNGVLARMPTMPDFGGVSAEVLLIDYVPAKD